GLLLTLGSLVSISVRLGAGLIADRRSGGNIRVVAVMIFIGSLGFLMLASQQPALMVAGVVIAFGAGWGFHGLFWLAVVRNSPHAPGAPPGSRLPAGLYGGTVGPIGFGLLAESVSYRAAWLGCTVAAVLAALAILAGRRVLLDF